MQHATELLNKGHYERIEQLLNAQREAAQRSGQLALVVFLAAASQICLSCQHLRYEYELHKQALEDAKRRERELRKQLVAIVEILLVDSSLGDTTLDETTAAFTATNSLLQEKIVGVSGKSEELGQRIQEYLDLEPTIVPKANDESERKAIYSTNETETQEGTVSDPAKEIAPETGATRKTSGLTKQKQLATSDQHMETAQSSLIAYCFGPFQVYLNDRPVESWPSGKGKLILKYLATHRKRPIAREVLMDLFWTEADSGPARNNLNVAIYALRKTLRKVNPDFSHVLFQDGRYLLNPDLRIWTDVEEFLKQYKLAQQHENDGDMDAAIRTFHTAETLYRGELFHEDRYEEWIIPLRRDFRIKHLDTLTRISNHYFAQEDYGACIAKCQKMLSIDTCLEDAHCQLMRCYSRQGQNHMAIHQYHQCRSMLKRELDVAPSPHTKKLFESIRQHDPV